MMDKRVIIEDMYRLYLGEGLNKISKGYNLWFCDDNGNNYDAWGSEIFKQYLVKK